MVEPQAIAVLEKREMEPPPSIAISSEKKGKMWQVNYSEILNNYEHFPLAVPISLREGTQNQSIAIKHKADKKGHGRMIISPDIREKGAVDNAWVLHKAGNNLFLESGDDKQGNAVGYSVPFDRLKNRGILLPFQGENGAEFIGVTQAGLGGENKGDVILFRLTPQYLANLEEYSRQLEEIVQKERARGSSAENTQNENPNVWNIREILRREQIIHFVPKIPPTIHWEDGIKSTGGISPLQIAESSSDKTPSSIVIETGGVSFEEMMKDLEAGKPVFLGPQSEKPIVLVQKEAKLSEVGTKSVGEIIPKHGFIEEKKIPEIEQEYSGGAPLNESDKKILDQIPKNPSGEDDSIAMDTYGSDEAMKKPEGGTPGDSIADDIMGVLEKKGVGKRLDKKTKFNLRKWIAGGLGLLLGSSMYPGSVNIPDRNVPPPVPPAIVQPGEAPSQQKSIEDLLPQIPEPAQPTAPADPKTEPIPSILDEKETPKLSVPTEEYEIQEEDVSLNNIVRKQLAKTIDEMKTQNPDFNFSGDVEVLRGILVYASGDINKINPDSIQVGQKLELPKNDVVKALIRKYQQDPNDPMFKLFTDLMEGKASVSPEELQGKMEEVNRWLKNVR